MESERAKDDQPFLMPATTLNFLIEIDHSTVFYKLPFLVPSRSGPS